MDADVYFHRVLAEIPGNPVFIALHEAFVARLMRSREAPGNMEKYLQQSNDDHREIVSAIMERNSERAVTVLTRHLERNYNERFRMKLKKKTGGIEASNT